MGIIIILILIVLFLMVFLLGEATYFVSKGKYFKHFYHNILQWHIPNSEIEEITYCTVCGRKMTAYNDTWVVR